MSQGSTILPTVGPIPGLTEQGLINAALAALLSNNSGGSAPASPVAYQFWADTSVSNTVTIRQYISGTWMPLWVIDTNLLTISIAPATAQNWAAASGTHDAITASYDPPLTTLVDGMVLYFRATAPNFTATPTFTPNPGVVTPHIITKLGGQMLWGADIPAVNAECAVRYNAANTRWELIGPTFDVPVGGLVPYFGGTPVPNGFVLPQGQNLSSAQFPIASLVLGTTYGNPGGGNFTMPDLRGRFFFNLDSGGSGRITAGGGNFDGTVLGNTGGTQSRLITQAMLPSVSFAISGITLSESPHSHTIGLGATPNGSPNAVEPAVPQNAIQGGVVQSNTTGITISSQGSAASGGSGQQIALIPPSMGINCMMRIA